MLQSLGGSLVQQRASCIPGAVSTRPPFQHRRPSAAGRLCSGFATGGHGAAQQLAQQRIGRDACIARAGKGFGTKKEAAASSTVPTGSCPCGSGRSYQVGCPTATARQICGMLHYNARWHAVQLAVFAARYTPYRTILKHCKRMVLHWCLECYTQPAMLQSSSRLQCLSCAAIDL